MGLEELKESIYTTTELPTLPVVAHQVMSATGEDEGSFKTLSGIVEKDPSLTMKLLGLANSVLYGQQREVSSIHRAISVVGTQTLRRLALCAFVKASWANDAVHEHFWRHSIAVAFGTSFLSEHDDDVSADDAFCAGLLHDVGILVLECVLPEAYREVELRLVEPGCREDVEQNLLGVDHTQVGAWFGHRWQLPRVLIEGIGRHHSRSESSISNMIRVVEQAARNAELGLNGEVEKAPVEHQDEVEAYLRSKDDEIETFLRMTSQGHRKRLPDQPLVPVAKSQGRFSIQSVKS